MKGKDEDIKDFKQDLKEVLSAVHRYDIKFERNGCTCSLLNENKEGELIYFIDYRLCREVIEEIIEYISI